MDNELIQAAERRVLSASRPPAEPRDPAMESSQRKVDDMAESAFVKLRGTDAELEKALGALRKLRDDTMAAASTLDAMADRVRRGELEPQTLPRFRSAFRDEADRQLRAASKRVNAEIEGARERAVSMLLPPLPPDGGKTREWKEDVRTAFQAADGRDASDKLMATWRRFAAEGHREPLRLLADSWGRDLYRSAGGSADTWPAVREALVLELVASPAFADNPVAARLRQLRSRVVREAADATASQVSSAIGRLDKAGGL